MTLASGDLSTGARFEYSSAYPAGEYEFYFKADDLQEMDNSQAISKTRNFTVEASPQEEEEEEDGEMTIHDLLEHLIFVLAAILLVIIVLYVVYRNVKDKHEDQDVSEKELTPPQPAEPPQAQQGPPVQQQPPAEPEGVSGEDTGRAGEEGSGPSQRRPEGGEDKAGGLDQEEMDTEPTQEEPGDEITKGDIEEALEESLEDTPPLTEEPPEVEP